MRHRVTCVFQTIASLLSLVILTLAVTIASNGTLQASPAYGQSTQVLPKGQTEKNIALPASPDSPDWPVPETPVLRPASEEGQQAIAQSKFPKSLECELYAAEPDVANIVAIHRDFQGRMFVCETFRQDKGVEDNRGHQNWMDDELAAQTVADRVRYIRKYIPDADKSYTAGDDRIRLLQDTTGDGLADSSKVFADHFNRIDMGTGAGVLSYRDKVYYTCIPDLFLLQDTNKDGVADKRQSLHTGFGVHFAFRGHDMHGLIVGHDGRLYFSIGDRGYNVSKKIKNLESGAVFRCELDGSNLEVIATGMRNPQELAFDDYGNLFTGDNNSDSSDKARFTEIVYGGDSGWRMYYQYMGDRGPFNREKLWQPYNENTPAYIVPPIANIADGPAGLEYYPGTGFGDEFKDRFFLCDFRGTNAKSGIRSFKIKPNGASWNLEDEQQPIWSVLTTDIDFGSDGRLYVADWVSGWQGVQKGRIYAYHDKEHFQSKLVREVESLLKSGLKSKTPAELAELLNHADRRLRLEAQFELVARNEFDLLKATSLKTTAPTLARVHALFGLGQLARSNEDGELSFTWLKPVLQDADDQVVIAATRLYGEPVSLEPAWLSPLLKHANKRVRFAAATGLADSRSTSEIPAIVEMLIENDNQDPMLRHAGIMAIGNLTRKSPGVALAAELGLLKQLVEHESSSVRIATCVAIRKYLSNLNAIQLIGICADPKIADHHLSRLLKDNDPSIVLEAARAIHDAPVNSAMPALAELIDSIELHHESDPLVRRILSANFRVGTKQSAEALVAYCINPKSDPKRRLEVIQWLAEWDNPPARDKVSRAWRPLDPTSRDIQHAQNALLSIFGKLTQDSDEIAVAAIESAGALGLTDIGQELLTLAESTTAATSTRIAALESLDKLQDSKLPEMLTAMAATPDKLDSQLLTVVTALTAKRDAVTAMPLIKAGLNRDEQTTSQAMIATLGTMNDDASRKILADALEAMIADKYSPALRLDVIIAAKQRKLDSLNELLLAYETARNKRDKDPLVAAHLDTASGGDTKRGKDIFHNKTAVSCIRCHKIGWDGGNVGPELTDLGSKHDRRYIIEAITNPNAVIAKGFDQQKVLTDEGDVHIGILKETTDEHIILLDSDGKEIFIDKETVEATKPGLSSMPANLHELLTPTELRDLVEFLANQKVDPKAKAKPAPVQ